MVTKHLTDDEVQQYALDKSNSDERITRHIHFCDECRAKADVYQVMITGIKQQRRAAFDFNLSEVVLQQLPSHKEQTSDRLLLWVLICIGFGFMGAALYYFEGSLIFLFKGIATIFIYLIIISAVTVFTWVFIDMYKKYSKEMKMLDSY